MSSPSSSSSGLPIIEGAAAEVIEEIVQTRVDERVADAVVDVHRQLQEEVNEEVDIRIAENAEAEHAKVEVERRRVADLESRLAEAERRAGQVAEAEKRADQAERRRVEAHRLAISLQSEIDAVRAQGSQSTTAPTSSRRFVAPGMTPMAKREDDARPSHTASQPYANPEAVDAAIRHLVTEQDNTMLRVSTALHAIETEQANLRAQLQANRSASSAQADMRLAHPASYTGLPGAMELSIRDFLPSLEIYFVAKGWSMKDEPRRCIAYAATRLTRDAARWYTKEYRAKMAADVDETWEYFVGRLMGKFEPMSESIRARNELAALRQAALTVGEYDAEFLRILSRIDDMSDTDQLLAYQAGLRRNIRDRLIGHVDTVDEAMQMALRVEQALTADRARYGFSRSFFSAPSQRQATAPTTTASNNSGPAPMELGNLQSDADHEYGDDPGVNEKSHTIAAMQDRTRGPQRRQFTAEQQRLYNEQRCFACHKRGHIKRDCPTTRQSKNE